MKNLIFSFLFIIIFSFSSTAQKISRVDQNLDFRLNVNGIPKNFNYISPSADFLTDENFVISFKISIDKHGQNNLWKSFAYLWKTANSFGANTFLIDSVHLTNNQFITIVKTYYLSDDLMEKNLSFYDKNAVILFGDLDTKNNKKKRKFKLNNNEEFSLLPYEYMKLQNETDSIIKIKNGILTSTIKGKENNLGNFIFLGSGEPKVSSSALMLPMGGGFIFGFGMGLNRKYEAAKYLNYGLFTMTILDYVKNSSLEQESGEITDKADN